MKSYLSLPFSSPRAKMFLLSCVHNVESPVVVLGQVRTVRQTNARYPDELKVFLSGWGDGLGGCGRRVDGS